MEGLIMAVIILASLLLIIVVFVQNPKGGGLSTDFGASHQLGGVKKTTDFIEKATWSLAGIIMVMSIWLTVSNKPAPTKTPAPAKQEQTKTTPAPNGQKPTGK